jgi:HAD superfamily hydrolase (TIGR01509 family)
MRTVGGIIFDCDGVLFESRQANLAYYNEVFLRLGLPLVDADDRARSHICHTAASPDVFAALLGPERSEEALACAATLDYRQFIPLMTPEPGMREALAALSECVPLAVATNRGASVVEILHHFGLNGYFSAVVTSRDVPRPKPHPDMLELAAERLRLGVSELVFVGDSELDREASRQARIRFVAYGDGTQGEMTISHHRELLALLGGR